MKNLYFLAVAGCMVFSQAHADTVYQRVQSKSQAEGRALSTLWVKTQTRHAFVDAFSDPQLALVIDESGTVRIVDSAANARIEKSQSVSAYLDVPIPKVTN